MVFTPHTTKQQRQPKFNQRWYISSYLKQTTLTTKGELSLDIYFLLANRLLDNQGELSLDFFKYHFIYPFNVSSNKPLELMKAIPRHLTILQWQLIIQFINMDYWWTITIYDTLKWILLWITDHSKMENSQWGGVIEGNCIVNRLIHEWVLVQGKTCDWMVTHV